MRASTARGEDGQPIDIDLVLNRSRSNRQLIQSLRRRALAVGVFLFTLGVAACGDQLVTAKALEAHAEAHLYYPGSTVVSTSRSDERSAITGQYPAELNTVLRTTGSSEEIYAWYSQQLGHRGWQVAEVVTVNGNYQLYTRGDRDVFQIGVVSGVETTYTLRLSVVPAPCATTPPTSAAFAKCG